MQLIEKLVEDGWLKTSNLIKAFHKIKRADFILKELKNLAEENEPLPIGQNQTISQPLTVAFMLELLEPKEGEKILDIGSGSGWTTALLSEIVGEKGKVISIELIPELKEMGERNVAKYSFITKRVAKFICADGSNGYSSKAPFDKILSSASSKEKIPQAWKDQLKIGGRIVAPIKSSIWLFIKRSKEEFEEREHPGFAFVPLIEKNEEK